jgi:regulator of RNase E activity RraB
MADQQVIMGLMKAGDNLEKARRVDHWIYFKNKNDKELFISYAIKNGFSIEKNGRNKADAEGKFGLQIFRTDKVDPNSIMQITTELKKEAQKFDGEYDGWETEVVK